MKKMLLLTSYLKPYLIWDYGGMQSFEVLTDRPKMRILRTCHSMRT